jgi:hypothetical protein
MENGNFSIIPRTKVPKAQDIKTRKVKKYKAHLKIDGSRMESRVHYWDTYATVAS